MVSTEVLVGSCLCGAVRYQATVGQVPMWYCHCRHCRKASGAAFASWIAVAEDQLQWLSGKEKIVCYSSSWCLQRCFCCCCGTVLPAPGLIGMAWAMTCRSLSHIRLKDFSPGLSACGSVLKPFFAVFSPNNAPAQT